MLSILLPPVVFFLPFVCSFSFVHSFVHQPFWHLPSNSLQKWISMVVTCIHFSQLCSIAHSLVILSSQLFILFQLFILLSFFRTRGLLIEFSFLSGAADYNATSSHQHVTATVLIFTPWLGVMFWQLAKNFVYTCTCMCTLQHCLQFMRISVSCCIVVFFCVYKCRANNR